MPTIAFQGRPTVEVSDPSPVPRLRVRATPNLTGIEGGQPPYGVLAREATVVIGGVRIPEVQFEGQPWLGEQYQGSTGFNLQLVADLHRYLIDAIEAGRADDVAGALNLGVLMARPGDRPQNVVASVELTFSEKQWVNLLEKAGYHTGWVAYIERGDIEGWSEVAKRISEAHDHLLARDPKGVLVACREAFRAADNVVSGDWPDIAAQIDMGSKPKAGYDPKSVRVKNLREWSLKMADTGGHAETYNATPEDADLVYGLTVDLLSYLSRKESHAQRARKL